MQRTKPQSGYHRLDEVAADLDSRLSFLVFECPDCAGAIPEYGACSACGWCNEQAWQQTMNEYSSCKSCGQTIGSGYLCDGCNTLNTK
jgi:hypothetical protein